MKHNDFKNNIYNYLNGELEGRDLEEFEIHYFGCLSCRDHLLSVKILYESLREHIRLSELSELKDITDAILTQIKKRSQKTKLTRTKRTKIEKPTRIEIEFFLSQEIDTLLITLGRSVTSGLATEFSPETAKKKGLSWFDL